MAKIKVGVFGARRGRVMIDLLMNHPDAQLVAVCDMFEPALESCKKKAEELNIRLEVFKSFDDFFQCDMDAVVLANYATEHAPYAIQLLESGRHILSECLTTQTLAEAVALTEAVEKSGKVYNFAENACFFKTTFEMFRRYRRGDIGEVQHCEGEYIHPQDLAGGFESAAVYNYGDPTHWRSRLYSTFYCSHATGPLFYITGTRPVKVIGMENPPSREMLDSGKLKGTTGTMLIQLSNGATMKAIIGGLRKIPSPHYFEVFGTGGCMETDRWKGDIMHLYTDCEVDGQMGYRSYECQPINDSVLARNVTEHGGSDFYATDFFIRNIMGDEEAAKYTVDIYQALDMCTPGILAYRSILCGNIPFDIPDLRIKEIREKYRYDTTCTDPRVAGAMLVPSYSKGDARIEQSTFEMLKKAWEASGKRSPYFK